MEEQQEIKELKRLVEYYEKVIKNMSVPIIPSIVPRTILVPIAGFIYRERFEAIRTKVLQYAAEHRETEAVIFDFTGVNTEDVEAFDYNELASELSQLNSAQKLMGLRPLYVGFNPRFAREIVHAGIQVELEVYTNFRAALTVLIKENAGSMSTIK
ncbi:STAS domain-containing protein [Planococcus sp. N028]|uniref:STAS domain-containing protein n=1 Tax=Planococcus shixiaomingii TaxID=3058393 RepID=A0ABT8N6R4_9BACL|nr:MULTISPECIES: STAS domain-containing protein [unclassified Planococcus (in: firmicutes)]MDN7243558.1 STAS domain-containing protein [Planococcus sp. N028]WKA55994.1 STAS domain-containing protein [Planococcus sp. N022]